MKLADIDKVKSLSMLRREVHSATAHVANMSRRTAGGPSNASLYMIKVSVQYNTPGSTSDLNLVLKLPPELMASILAAQDVLIVDQLHGMGVSV